MCCKHSTRKPSVQHSAYCEKCQSKSQHSSPYPVAAVALHIAHTTATKPCDCTTKAYGCTAYCPPHLQVIQDISDECNKYGTVLRVVVPRPADPALAAEVRRAGQELRVLEGGGGHCCYCLWWIKCCCFWNWWGGVLSTCCPLLKGTCSCCKGSSAPQHHSIRRLTKAD